MAEPKNSERQFADPQFADPPAVPSGLAPPPAEPRSAATETEPRFAAPDTEPGFAAPGSEPTPPPAAVAPRSSAPVKAGAAPPTAIGMDITAGGMAGASLAADPPAAAATQPFDVVQVFYGTDRQAAAPAGGSLGTSLVRFLPPICALLVTVCLAMVAAGRRTAGSWLLAAASGGVMLGLAWQATAKTVRAIRYASHEGIQYTTGRSSGGAIERGVCEVTIPRSHVVGELEAPSVLRLEVREDASRHVVLRKTERLGDEAFYTLLRERVAASPSRELFVFVHGFNVSFQDAARRTAQISHDLKFAGAPVFFSWPAHDKFVITYTADEANVAWSAPHLKQFLLEIVKESQAQSVNLIAHSMGNRALAAALREIELELRDQSRLFNQVILAAPDIDADEFRSTIAPAMQRTARRLTLYASSRDDALLASQLLHRSPRAGDAGQGLVVVPGIDTIDVTAIDSSPWGHSYYGSSDPVLQDLKLLLTQAAEPSQRLWLSPAERNGLTYWIFQPSRTAGSGALVPR
jgi:esterase/lipase superfamily enzyme